MESVKELLGHASITTTVDTYGHLTVEDARQTLEAAGWFTGREVRLVTAAQKPYPGLGCWRSCWPRSGRSSVPTSTFPHRTTPSSDI